MRSAEIAPPASRSVTTDAGRVAIRERSARSSSGDPVESIEVRHRAAKLDGLAALQHGSGIVRNGARRAFLLAMMWNWAWQPAQTRDRWDQGRALRLSASLHSTAHRAEARGRDVLFSTVEFLNAIRAKMHI
jgi:hypothetical protein